MDRGQQVLNRRCHRLSFTMYFAAAVAVVFIFSSCTEADSQRFVVDQMQTFHLNCSVKNQGATSKWSKQQIDNTNPTPIFLDEKPAIPKTGDFVRYNATKMKQTDGSMYSLHIQNTQPQDSGMYTCEILDGDGNTMLKMNTTLEVIDSIGNVVLFKNYSNINATTNTTGQPFYYSIAHPGSLGCHIVGGNPQPNVTLSLASNTQFRQKLLMAEKMWRGSVQGFQKPSWQVVLYADQITMLPEYDGTMAVCTAMIHSYNASSSNTILVEAFPYFHPNGCDSEQSFKAGSRAQLSCRFHSHPSGQVVWSKQMKSDSTSHFQTINPSDDPNGLQATNILDGNNDFVAKLLFPKLTDDDFQNYQLAVTNDLGNNATIIKLSSNSASQTSKGVHYQFLVVTGVLWKTVFTLV